MEFLMTKTIVMEFFVLICPLCGQANERIVFVEGFSTLFSIWGFRGGLVLMLVLIVTTKPLAGHYLYPLYPFNWKALKHLLLRQPISRDNT